MTTDRPAHGSWFPGVAPAPPRTLDEALERSPGLTLAVIGAPRAVVAVEVRRALELGLDVLVVGAGLSPAAAVEERAFAAARGLLLLEGDACVDGVVLAGALLEPPRLEGAPPGGPPYPAPAGGLGIVAADEGGAVEASAAAERAGFGASHILLVGAGDLASEGGGVASLAAIARLGRDPSTSALVVVGAGDARVLRALQHAAVATGKVAVVCAHDGEARRGLGWEWIATVRDLPRALVRLGAEPSSPRDPVAPAVGSPAVASPGARILGVLGAASTAHAVLAELAAARLDVASNVPRAGVLPEDVGGHTVVALTDPVARAAWLRDLVDDGAPRVVLVDLPATRRGEADAGPVVHALRDLVAAAREGGGALRVVVARARPAGWRPCAIDEELAAMGAWVADGAGAAGRLACVAFLRRGEAEARSGWLAGRPLSVTTLAADPIAAFLEARGVPVTPIAWTAPAGGDPRIARLVGLLR